MDKVEDPLKPLDEIREPDERSHNFVAGLEDNHAELNDIVLNDAVPLEVRQLFETAKNLSLYSWFVYRFHQVAELVSFTALEMALRERYQKENPQNEKRLMLRKLLTHAKSQGWIKEENFSGRMGRARHAAEMKKIHELMQSQDGEGIPVMEIPEPTEAEIQEALKTINMVDSVVKAGPEIRNILGHGSSMLHPNSITTLKINAEVINQLFP